MTQHPKYRVTVYHPKWYNLNRDRQVSLEQWDGRSHKYKAVSIEHVGVRDMKRV